MNPQSFTHVNSTYVIPGMQPTKATLRGTIISDVADAFEVDVYEIMSKCKNERVTFARWAIIKILASRGYGKADIGRVFNQDHTTIIHALNNIDRDIANNKSVQMAWDQVSHYYIPKKDEPVNMDTMDTIKIKDLKVSIIGGVKTISPKRILRANSIMKILYLTLKKQWFDMILSGEKKEEYRELKPYWRNRFCNDNGSFKEFDIIRFTNGYSKDAPTFDIEFKGIRIGTGRKEWGSDESGFVLGLGKILSKNIKQTIKKHTQHEPMQNL